MGYEFPGWVSLSTIIRDTMNVMIEFKTGISLSFNVTTLTVCRLQQCYAKG